MTQRPLGIGIVDDGQLGQMLARAASDLGHSVGVLGKEGSPASQVATLTIGDLRRFEDVYQFGLGFNVVTIAFEEANQVALRDIAKSGTRVHPAGRVLGLIKNKRDQHRRFADAGIPVATFEGAMGPKDVMAFGRKHGYPLVLKACLGSYDGKGNTRIETAADIASAWARLSGRGELYVEKQVPFVRELSVVIARDIYGYTKTYPVVETRHVRDVCDTVIAPAPISEAVAEDARELAERVVQLLGGVGVFGVELFEEPDGLKVNEVAPRVHNSGHWTLDGAQTNQFTQHILAITGQPLGTTAMTHPAAVMINILGRREGPAEPTGVEEAEQIPGVTVYIYGKADTGLDRKMGHINAVGQTVAEAMARALRARHLISI